MGGAGVERISAQEPPARPDTAQLSPGEALRARQRERLERLSRAPGQDTLDLQPLDTTPALTPSMDPRDAEFAIRPDDLGMTGDTIFERLLRDLVGYDPVEYEAVTARFEARTRDLILRGDTANRVTVRYDDQQVNADSIHFNQVEDLVDARGQPVYTPRDGRPVESQRLLVDTRTQEASAFGARTEYTEGATWRVTGDLPRVRTDLVFASHARFTSCDLDVPHYHFAAEQIKIVRGNVLVARPVRLYFADVPVLWLPFVAQSLSEGRASGLLTPRFSVNDVVRSSGGYQRRISNVGFYWAANDYMDATVALDWFSGNFTALTGGLRYRWLDRFLQGSINARQYWQDGGGTQFGLNSQQSWEMSERTNLTASVAYVSSTSFLRRNTFDPREATQTISSSGGLNRRFDWGSLSLSANRSQSLSDDRVDFTFPTANLSLRSVTLFPAPASRQSWFNNMTWSGGGSVTRRLLDYPDQPTDEPFRFGRADQATATVTARHSLDLGNFSIGQSMRLQDGTVLGVPKDTLPFFPGLGELSPFGDLALAGSPAERVDVGQSRLEWTTSLSYQQQLVGSTSLTPSVSFSGSALRSDTIELAQRYVSEPTRLSLGATLRSDMYGFFPGFGGFEALRHKVSPSFSYSWAPRVEPTDLQRQIFGSRAASPVRTLTVNLSQTFEAKRLPEPEREPLAAPPDPAPQPADDTTGFVEPDVEPELEPEPPEEPGGATRRPQGETVTLLGLRTSAIHYDFVQADSAGSFLQGFTTTRLRNDITSDYLRGLTLSVEHDLFRDPAPAAEGQTPGRRAFAPHLSAVNLAFSLDARSGIVRRLGLGPGTDAPPPDTAAEPPLDVDDPFGESRTVTDEASIIPGRRDRFADDRVGGTASQDWSASLSYALSRPRDGVGFGGTTQNLQIDLRAHPTPSWRMAWRTSYDVQRQAFNDHMVRLTRDLHRWQANFDFLKTATGNWAFRFEVSLLDNSDLKFDYQQRSVDAQGRPLGP